MILVYTPITKSLHYFRHIFKFVSTNLRDAQFSKFVISELRKGRNRRTRNILRYIHGLLNFLENCQISLILISRVSRIFRDNYFIYPNRESIYILGSGNKFRFGGRRASAIKFAFTSSAGYVDYPSGGWTGDHRGLVTNTVAM